MAERVGFEPTERFPVHSISSAANSTTLAPLPGENFGFRIANCGIQRINPLRSQKRLGSKTNPQSEFRNPKSLHPFMPRRETISLYWCTNLSGDPSTIQPEEVPTQLLSIPVKGFLSRTRRINSFAAFKKSSQLDT